MLVNFCRFSQRVGQAGTRFGRSTWVHNIYAFFKSYSICTTRFLPVANHLGPVSGAKMGSWYTKFSYTLLDALKFCLEKTE